MSKKQTITIEGNEIVVLRQNAEDYISLTDMAKVKNAEATGLVISHWLSTRYVLDYLGIFERLNNPDFNVTEFSNIRNEAGSNGFVLTVKQWVGLCSVRQQKNGAFSDSFWLPLTLSTVAEI